MSLSSVVSERYGHDFEEDGDVVVIFDEERAHGWIRSTEFASLEEVTEWRSN